MKYRNIKVKKAGGGYRTQRAMVLASGKLKFVKNHGGSTHHAKSKKKGGHTVAKKSKAVVKYKYRNKPTKHRKHRRGGASGGHVPLLPLIVGGAALGYATSASGPAFIRDTANKIPGSKTFGPAATLGAAALVVDRYVHRNKWLRYAGYAGIALAALQLGQKNSTFKWVGDADDVGDYDLSDVEGDDDVSGDDDMGDADDVSGDDD